MRKVSALCHPGVWLRCPQAQTGLSSYTFGPRTPRTIRPRTQEGVRGMNRTIRAALAALALTAILATPALAAKPLVETNEESGTFRIPCGTVTLVETWSQSVVLTTWLDGDGEPTRAHARVRFDGTITAPGST